MRLSELTMPLDHQWMPDEIFPTATRFMLAPRGDPEKGITVGTESGTSLLLRRSSRRFRAHARLHEIEPPELILRETAVVDLPCEPRQEIGRDALAAALGAADCRDGDALLLRTGLGRWRAARAGHDAYLLDTPHLGLDGPTTSPRPWASGAATCCCWIRRWSATPASTSCPSGRG